MLGGMLAGHDQSGGEIIEKEGKKYKLFYGMSSTTAMNKYTGGVKEYRFVQVYGTYANLSPGKILTCDAFKLCEVVRESLETQLGLMHPILTAKVYVLKSS